MTQYFYDAYALIEITKGNKNYAPYASERLGVTTKIQLMKLYYWALKDLGLEKAEEYYDTFQPLTMDFDDNSIKEAAKKRLEWNKKGGKISYSDALGYQLATENGLKFLTGDKEFKELPGVEFVK